MLDINLSGAFRNEKFTEWRLTIFSSRFRDDLKTMGADPVEVATFISACLTEKDVPHCYLFLLFKMMFGMSSFSGCRTFFFLLLATFTHRSNG